MAGKAAVYTAKYRNTLLRVGQRAKCKITWMYSPGHFYISLAEGGPQLERVMGQLQQGGQAGELGRAHRGQAVAARWGDGCWYRGQVTKVSDSDLEIFFVDFGNTETVSRESVTALPLELGHLEAQAVRVGLGLDREGGWQGVSLTHYFSQELWHLEVLAAAGGREWLVSPHPGEVEAALVRDGLAKRRKSSSEAGSEAAVTAPGRVKSAATKQFRAGDFPAVPSSSLVGRAVTGTVTQWTSWKDFCLQPDSAPCPSEAALAAAGEEGGEVVSLEEGECCLARWRAAWHRAAVVTKAEPSLQVTLVDSGKEVQLPLAELRSAKDFSLYSAAPAAVRCRLDTRLEDMEALLEATGQRLSVQVRSFNNNQFCVKLEKEKTEKERRSCKKAARKGREVKETGGRRSVTVVHVSRCDLVWVVERERLESLQEMMVELGEWMEEEEHCTVLEEVREGALCCVRYSEDGEMYRAVVAELGEEEAEVQYIDYGNTETVAVSELLVLPPQFSSAPAAALPVSVRGAGLALDCEETRGKLEQALAGDSVSVLLEGEEAGQLFVRGKRLDTGRLLRLGGQVNIFQVAASPRLAALVSWWSEEEEVWLLSRELEGSLARIMARLEEAWSGSGLARVREGDLVAAPFSQDSLWYRARVTAVEGGEASLLFVDYGNREIVAVSALRCLPAELRLHPGLAMAASVCRQGARVLARDQLRGLVTAGVEVTAELVQPREGRVRLYLGGEAVCPPPQGAVARLRPGGPVLGVARLGGQGELCVQVLAQARAVSAALCGAQGEGVEEVEGAVVLELSCQPKRLVCYGEGRFLSVDTGQEVYLPGSLSLLPCPASVARLPSAALVTQPRSQHLFQLSGRLTLVSPVARQLTALPARLHVTATFGKTPKPSGCSPVSECSPVSMFSVGACLEVSLPLSAASWSAIGLCEARDRAVGRQLGLEGGQLGLEGGHLGLEGGQLGLEGGQLGLEGGQLGLEGGQLGLEGGQEVAAGGGGTAQQDEVAVVVAEAADVKVCPLLEPVAVAWEEGRQEVTVRGEEVEVVIHPALPCLVLKTEGEELVVQREGREGRLVASLPRALAAVREAVAGLVEGEVEEREWLVGELCLYVGGGVCQRALVLHSRPAMAELLLLDEGGLRTLCHPEELRPLSEALLGLPAACVSVRWRGARQGGLALSRGARHGGLALSRGAGGELIVQGPQ